MYAINEMFYTIQGEARFTGCPSFFIRLQGCSVGCGWCDRKHTWKTSDEDQVSRSEIIAKDSDSPCGSLFPAEYLINHINSMAPAHCHVVITGGEPFEQDLAPLVSSLKANGNSIQIETSGTAFIPEEVAKDAWITLSPKHNMTGGLTVLESSYAKADELKNPIGKMSDIENAIQDSSKLRDGVLTWLQPISQSAKATKLCIEEVKKRPNWRLSIQTHKYSGVR